MTGARLRRPLSGNKGPDPATGPKRPVALAWAASQDGWVEAARLLAIARAIDPDRARSLLGELGDEPERAASVLLGTAFPPLTPGSESKLAGVARLVQGGIWVERRRRDLASDAEKMLETASDPPAFFGALQRFVWLERARIALRELLPPELGGAPIDVTARELSALADVALGVALHEARVHVAARFGEARQVNGRASELCAFGMGKLGGRELNAGSDVDLIFVYDTDEGDGEITLNDFWTRVVRRAVATLETPNEDGAIWRVDLRLRPEGSGGALANSVAATDRYYETWGRLWERAALLRARPVAGSQGLGELVTREVFSPFVYRHAVDPGIAEGISELLLRSRRELSEDPARDLKLGPGGIREVEFFVQILQLVWGGRELSLRVPNTLDAVARLQSRGLVSGREARVLLEGYTFLRRLEHRVQWMSGLQTHLVPASGDELARLGRTLGHADERPLVAELTRVRSAIADLFASIAPGRSRARPSSRFDRLLASLGDGEAVNAEAERLFGTGDVGEHLSALSRRAHGLLGELTRDRFPKLAGELLEELSGSPDPEQAARYLRTFFARFSAADAYVTALGEDPHRLARFIGVLGSSSFVGDALVARPELADTVLFGEGKVSDPRAAISLELESRDVPAPSDVSDVEREERFVLALRMVKRRVMAEVAVADLAGAIGTREATRLLADLADEVLSQSVDHVLGPEGRGLAVLALGKLGGRDLGYGSDLDVIFIYDPKFAPSLVEAPNFFARRAQRIIRLISEPSMAGPGYELDTRLRPSGSQGMLVTSLGAFARYHGVEVPEARESGSSPTSSGAAWERQALLRARSVAGDADTGRRALAIAERAAYEGGAPPALELAHLRKRMEVELGRERNGRYDLKSGRGGLLDIEFGVQWLQMRHGAETQVRTPDIGAALESLRAAGYIKRQHYGSFRDGYRFLRRLEQRLHVLSGRSSSSLDVGGGSLEPLARRMHLQDEPGATAGKKLLLHYLSVTASVRAAYLEILGLPREI